MKKATAREIVILAAIPGMKVFVLLAGSFRVTMSLDLKELRTMLRFQTLNQPMEISYEIVGSELFINAIDILPL